MKILYLCGLYSENLLPFFYENMKNGRLQDAANTYQYAVLEGLVENEADFYVLSFPFLPCYPHNFASISIPEDKILYDGREVGESATYSSLLLYKPYSIKRGVRRHVEEWIRNNIKDNEPFAVLTYSYDYFFIEPLLSIKRTIPNMRVGSIITDLVENASSFMSNRSLLKRIQMYFVKKRMRNCLKGVDKFILLTSDMVELIPEAEGKNIVIEGIYRNSADVEQNKKLPKTLLYSGTFQEFAGVKLLVDAFMATSDPQFRLMLCGSGPCSDYIETCAEKDHRINALGRLNRNEVLRLQQSVALLVNPRQPNGGITRFSFPSKTIEYMSSGTPMIGYKLEGIPTEYFDYMSIPENLTVEALAFTIERELSLPDDVLSVKGAVARDFILHNKTAEMQVAKLMEFIST